MADQLMLEPPLLLVETREDGLKAHDLHHEAIRSESRQHFVQNDGRNCCVIACSCVF